MKNFKKISAILFFSAYLILGLNFATPVSAADEVKFTPQIGIPGSEFVAEEGVSIGKKSGTTIKSDLLARYVKAFYSWGLSIVGVLAVLMLMAGGLIWLTSAGDSGKIENAKKMISGSLFGSLLLVGAYFFLNTINPDLTRLPTIEMENIEKRIVESFNQDAGDGFIDDTKNLPSDTEIKWVCMNSKSQTCQDTIPPTVNIDNQICYKKLGMHSNCGYGLAWCCGKSATLQKNNNSCEGKDTGDACKITSTASNGSGYCLNNKCVDCKEIGSACSGGLKNYECVGKSGFCGKPDDGTSDCNCKLFGSCECDDTWK